MNSRDYWLKREAEALKIRITDEKEYQKEIQQIYQNMLDACQKEIESFYAKYASAEGITIAEAKKRVSKHDVKAFERKAAKYVKDKDFSAKANEELRLYNATMKINRLEMLKANIGLETIAGHDELEKFMAGILKGRTEDELKRQAGILGKSVLNNASKAEAIVNGSFKVAKVGEQSTFSDRIWQYQDNMRQDLGKLLQQGLIQGKNPRAITKELRKYWYGNDPKTGGGAKYCMERLMRTELARVQTEAQKQSFIRNGYEHYEFIVNTGCCPLCRAIDGKHFEVAKMMPGTNAPPMHPNCRCSTAAWEDDEEYEAWLDYLDQGGTTEEWNAKGKKSWEKSRKTLENSGSGYIINLKGFNTTADPMREVTGAGLKSHPEETQRIVKELEAAGAEIEYRSNAMCYQPSLSPGRAGRFVIDEEASYSAWRHEETHFLDDKEDGYPGFRIFQDTEKCIQREVHAYDVEIELAIEAGRPDIAERLEELKRKEVARYYAENATDD